MTYQEMVRERAAVRGRSEPLLTAWSDQLTISSQLIERRTQPEYRAECLATEDWPVGAGETQCDWLSFVHKQLQAIESLPDGWDSYGAPRPSASILSGARNLIECLSQAPGLPQPYVNPTRNGGVQFEWEAGERYFELEVLAERAATYYWRDHSNADQQEGTVFEGDRLDTVLEYVRRVEA
ncbi:MAG: hypothetical protein ABIP48_17895 [Planctomycetota bacterium]